jgi:hypothetical protein
MKTKNGLLILILSIFIFSGSIVLSGCGGGAGSSSGGTASGSSSSPAGTITGQVKGGLTAIAGATVQLYGCTAQTASSCTPISTPVSTSSSGGFTIVYNPSSADTTYYLQATEGSIELQAIVPSNIPSGGITINEYSTFVTQEAFNYGQENNLGATASYIEGLMADPTSATPASISSAGSLSAIEPYLVTMADDLAACIDAAYTANPTNPTLTGTACTNLESDVTTATATTAPTTVTGILGNIAATLTTYYSNMTNGTDSGALTTMQNNLYSLLPSSPDFTFTFPSTFAPVTVEQPPIGSSIPNVLMLPPPTAPPGLIDMYKAGCLQCHTLTAGGVTYGPGAPFNEGPYTGSSFSSYAYNPYYAAPDLSYVANYLNFLGIGIAVDVMASFPTAGIGNLLNPLSDAYTTGSPYYYNDVAPLSASDISTIDGYLETLSVGSGNYVLNGQEVTSCPSSYTSYSSNDSNNTGTANGNVCVDTTNAVTIMQTGGCLGCHTINGESATGFQIWPAGAVGPDLSDIGTIFPKNSGSYINYAFGCGNLNMISDGPSGVLAFVLNTTPPPNNTSIASILETDLGGSNTSDSAYFTKPLLLLSAPVEAVSPSGTNGYESVPMLQELCFLCHYVKGYNGITTSGHIIVDNSKSNSSGYGIVNAITVKTIDVSTHSCGAMGYFSGGICNDSCSTGQTCGSGGNVGTVITNTLYNNPPYGQLYDGGSGTAKPSGLTATSGPGAGEVTLSWTPASDSSNDIPTSFIVLDSTSSSGPFSIVAAGVTGGADYSAGNISYTVSGLTSGTTYYFEVEGFNGSIGKVSAPPAAPASAAAQ